MGGITKLYRLAQGRITALVDHFSTFGLGMSPPGGSYGAQHLPTIHGFSHNEWSGNSSVSYPFILPPAPGNMPFGLGLSYSSEGVNSLFSSASDIYGSELPRYRRQASTIGWGWNLTGLGSITRNLSGDNGAMYLGFSNGSFEMKPDTGASTWWHTEPQSFIKIKASHAERRYASKWEVFTQDGTRYTFGSDNWGNGVAFNMNTEGICPLPDRVLREAHLTEIRDASGNIIKITYATEGRRWHNGCDGDYNNNNLDYNYVRAIRPTIIEFIPTGQTQATVKITLSYSSGWRLDGATVVESSSSVDVYSQTTWSEQNLNQILVQIWGDPANGNGSWTTFRRYGLHQNQRDNYNNGEPLLVLRGIYDYGAITSGGTPLPGYTFEYSRLNGGWRNTNVLRWAHNGQGGKTYYNYAWRSGLPITGCGSATAGRYVVDYIEVHDGMNNKSTTKFTHNSPFIAGSRYDPNLGRWCTQGFEFGGWGHVVRELKQNVTDTASLQRTETWYYQREGNEVGAHAGLMQRQSHYNPQTLQEFERVSTTYSIEIPGAYSPSSTKWVKKTSEVHKTFNFLDTNQPTIRITTTYEYNTAYQGSFQWGHPTHVRQFAHGATTPTRTTVTNYYGAWINDRFVVQPFESTLWTGSSCLSHTRMYHDGSNVHGTYGSPLRGLVTKTSVATVACYGSNWSNTTYSYDGWGNLRYVVDPRGKQTETRYDTTDNLSNPLPRLFAYPISTHNHLGQSVTLNWDERVGQVKQTTDPNNQSTHYKYDRFWTIEVNVGIRE